MIIALHYSTARAAQLWSPFDLVRQAQIISRMRRGGEPRVVTSLKSFGVMHVVVFTIA